MADVDWQVRLAEAGRTLAEAHAARDEAVRAAAAANVSPTAIARAVGLSRAHVYRIIEDRS